MKKQRILMILDLEYPKDERVEKEAESLVKFGHEVTICSANFGGKSRFDEINGVKIIRVKIPKIIKNKLYPFVATIPFYRWFWVHRVSKIIRKGNYNIIHCHDLPICSVGWSLKKKFPNLIFVADQHENYPSLLQVSPFMENVFISKLVNIKAWYKAEKKWLRRADGIIVTARGMKERLERVQLKPRCWGIIENTIRLEDFPEYKGTPDPNYITLYYSGGMNKHRGLQYALEGYKMVKKKFPNLRFWLVGGGGHVDSLKSTIEKENIKDVKFWGWVTTKEMFKIMQRADICLIPHLRSEHTDNTSPNKIFHYFKAQKPILVSNCNYLIDKINESNAGYYYENRNAMDFALKLEKLIENRDNINFGKNGHIAVMEKFNWNETSKKLADFYSCLS